MNIEVITSAHDTNMKKAKEQLQHNIVKAKLKLLKNEQKKEIKQMIADNCKIDVYKVSMLIEEYMGTKRFEDFIKSNNINEKDKFEEMLLDIVRR